MFGRMIDIFVGDVIRVNEATRGTQELPSTMIIHKSLIPHFLLDPPFNKQIRQHHSSLLNPYFYFKSENIGSISF